MRQRIIFLLLLALLSVSCSSINATYLDENYIKHYFLAQKKNTTLYKDYHRVLIMEVLYFDWTLRKNFLKNYNDNYFIKNNKLLTQHQKEYQKEYQFFVLIALQDTPSKLEQSDAYWKFFLKDWNTKNYASVKIKKIKKTDLYYQFIANNYTGLDNWTELYLLKTERDFTISKAQNLILQISSLGGTARVEWNDPNIFFSIPK